MVVSQKWKSVMSLELTCDSFARGITTDEAAVGAAITSPWSNGQTEGQITRIKLVRRWQSAGFGASMRGRGTAPTCPMVSSFHTLDAEFV